MEKFWKKRFCVRTKNMCQKNMIKLYSVISWFETLEKSDGYGKIISEMKSN